jgi:hypothetical protein
MSRYEEIKQNCQDSYIRYLSSVEHQIDYPIADCKLMLKALELACKEWNAERNEWWKGVNSHPAMEPDWETPDYWLDQAQQEIDNDRTHNS